MMLSSYQQHLRELKSCLLQGVEPDLSCLPGPVALSWQNSLSYGVKPDANSFPEVSPSDREHTKRNISNVFMYTMESYSDYFQVISSFLDRLHAAILFADSDLFVFNKFGNKDLINELKRKNISFGSNFSESRVGTNALSLAKKTGQAWWIHENEHFCQALSDYVCLGMVSLGTIKLDSKYYYQLIIIPKEFFDDIIAASIEYFAYSYIKMMDLDLLEVSASYKLLDQLMVKHHSVYLVINRNEKIIKASQYLLEAFDFDRYETIGDKLENKLPELKPILEKIRFNQEVTMEEIVFPKLNEGSRSSLVDATPIYTEGTLIGTAIILQNKNRISTQIRKFLHNGTYFTLDDLIGESPFFKQLKQLIKQAADSPGNVLIIGESGTGKELIAQSIHNLGSRSNQPFISLNCASIPKELIGSELFGYVEGAFTGARKGGAPGKFELAQGGTLFLDEIGDMPLDMQAVLLRVLEDFTITRLGGSKARRVDVRIIAATNKNLWEYVGVGKFRMDLYFRLNVIRLESIPLRQRLDDLPMLTHYILKNLSQTYSREVIRISPSVMQQFYQYSWPGNIRELRNLLERIVNTTRSVEILPEHLPPDFTRELNATHSNTQHHLVTPSEAVGYSDFERQHIKTLMMKFKGNKSAVAKEMDITRQTLYSRLKKYGLE